MTWPTPSSPSYTPSPKASGLDPSQRAEETGLTLKAAGEEGEGPRRHLSHRPKPRALRRCKTRNRPGSTMDCASGGRTGRALIHALLRGKGLARNVTVPVSAGLLADTDSYFDALTTYREGDPEPIILAAANASLRA